MRRLAALLLLALFAPLASAETVTLRAETVSWGAGRAVGPLVMLQATGNGATPALTLDAARLDVAWDESTAYVGGPVFLSLAPTTGETHYDLAHLALTGGRAGWSLSLLPANSAEAWSECGNAAASDDLSREVPRTVDGQRPPISADTSAAVELHADAACPAPVLHLGGDVLIVLWELDGVFTTANDSAPFQSGHYDTTTARQYFITAHDAALTFQGTPATPGDLYAAGLTVAADALTLGNVQGTAAGLAIDAPAAVLHGSGLTATLNRDADGLTVLATHAASLDLDGTTVRFESAPGPWRLAWWLAAVPLLVLAAWWLRYNSTPVLVRRVERLARGELPGSDEEERELAAQVRAANVVHLASRILKRRDDALVRVLRGESHLILGRFQEALPDFEAAQTTRKWGVVAAVGCAAALSALHRDMEALDVLRSAFKQDAAYVRLAMAEMPELRRLWNPRNGASEPSYA